MRNILLLHQIHDLLFELNVFLVQGKGNPLKNDLLLSSSIEFSLQSCFILFLQLFNMSLEDLGILFVGLSNDCLIEMDGSLLSRLGFLESPGAK